MRLERRKLFTSHGSGSVAEARFARRGENVVIESTALIFHGENIWLEDNVYIGHLAILNGYHKGSLHIGSDTWIGPQCLLHAAGGIRIGCAVGIGPGTRILTSEHDALDADLPVMHTPLRFAPVVLEDGCDIGVGCTLLPGVVVREGAVVGAGAVVDREVGRGQVWAGVPARFLRNRSETVTPP